MTSASVITRHRPKRLLPIDRLQTAVRVAEAVANSCEREQRWINELEFRSIVVKAIRNGKRALNNGISANSRNQYLDMYVQLKKSDQRRLDVAMRRASGNYVDPSELLRRCGELLRKITDGGTRITAEEFYREILGRRVEGLKRALEAAYQETLGQLAPRQVSQVEATRTAVVGLRPGVRGHARRDIFVRLARARDIAAHAHGEMSLVDFRRDILESHPSMPDGNVHRAFWLLREAMSEHNKVQLDMFQEAATGRVYTEGSHRKDLNRILMRAEGLAMAVKENGQPILRHTFYRIVLEYDSDSPKTTASMVSRYSGRMTESQRARFNRARDSAIGKREGRASGSLIFGPVAHDMEEQVRALAPRTEGFDSVTMKPEPMVTPANEPRPDMSLPGTPLDAPQMKWTEKFPMLPEDAWKKMQIPPTTGRLHTTPKDDPDADELEVPVSSVPLPAESAVTVGDVVTGVHYERNASWVEGLRISIPAPNQQVVVFTGAAVLLVGAVMLLGAPVGI